MRRDFSDESKQKMLNLVAQVEQEKLCNFTDWVGDRWYDFQDWIGVLDIQHYIDDVNTYHKKVIDKNNATEQAIIDIFNAVGAADHDYAAKFSQTRSALEKWKRYIEQLTEIVNPFKGRFTTEYMGNTLNTLLEDALVSINEVEETEDNTQEELVARMLELAKALLKINDEDSNQKDIGGLVASFGSYYQKLVECCDGDAENAWVIYSEAFELTETGINGWEEFLKLLKYYYDLKKIPGEDVVGLSGDFLSIIAAILEAIGKDYDTVGERIGEAIKNIGGSITDFGAAILKMLEKGASAAVSIYAGIAKAILASYGQFIESLEEYAKDGSFNLGDVADTGVDVAVAGLAALISTVTKGIISENTTGITEEEVREQLKNSADQLGKDAAEYIMNNPKLREMYNNGNGAERAMLIAYAVAMVQYGPTPGVPGKNYTGDPDDIAVQIALDKSENIPGEYQWVP